MRYVLVFVLTLICFALAGIWAWVSVMTYAFAGGLHVPRNLADVADAPLYYGVIFGAPPLILVTGLFSARLWRASRSNAQITNLHTTGKAVANGGVE